MALAISVLALLVVIVALCSPWFARHDRPAMMSDRWIRTHTYRAGKE